MNRIPRNQDSGTGKIPYDAMRQLGYTQGTPSKEAFNIIKEDYKKQIDSKERELTDTKRRCEDEIERLKLEKSNIEKAKYLNDKEKDKLIEILDTKLQEKINKINELEKILKDIPEIRTLQTKISALEKEKSKRDAILEKGKLDIERARNRIKQLEDQLTYYKKDGERETIQLKEQMNRDLEELKDLRIYHEREEIRIKTLEKEKGDIKKELLNSQRLFEDLFQKCNKTSSDNERLKQNLEKIKEKKKRAEEKIEFHKQALVLANSELKARDSQILERDNRIGRLQNQIKAFLKKYQGQKEELENEIIVYIAEGQTNAQIAENLFLSNHTVNTHRKNIMAKLGVKNTAGIVMYAVKTQLVSPNKFLFANQG